MGALCIYCDWAGPGAGAKLDDDDGDVCMCFLVRSGEERRRGAVDYINVVMISLE